MFEVKYLPTAKWYFTVILDMINKTGEFSDRIQYGGINDKTIYESYIDYPTLFTWEE